MEKIKTALRILDDKVSRSTFGRVFRLHGSGHPREIADARFLTEIRAGFTTFFTMAYIIAVNSTIIANSGGSCVCHDGSADPYCMNDTTTAAYADYATCQLGIKRDIVTATSVIAGLGSIMFGFLTNLPIALAPGMGLNAYFAYQVVGFHGSGPVKYQLALLAVFTEGLIFVGLSLLGLRQWLVKVIPQSIKIASGVGIGLFLTEIGLSYSAGIGAITGGATATPLALGGCASQYLNPETGACSSHVMTNPQMWIGFFCGGILVAFLMAFRFKLSIIAGIALVSIISWPRNTSFTYFPHTADGDAMFDFFKPVVGFHPITNTLNVIEWNIRGNSTQFCLALFTFLYVDIIDCTATLYSMARFAGVVDPESGDFSRSTIAYCTDAMTISIGAVFGLSPVTAFVESGSGITEGGRTGLTAMITGTCFLISIFFSPVFASIPPWATGGTLCLVGMLMMRQVTAVNWRYIGDALPAFVTLAFMPLSYSVAYGLIAGLITYTTLNGLIYITKLVTCGHIAPPDADLGEYWTAFPKGGRLPWYLRLPKNGGRFWEHEAPTKDEHEDTPSEVEIEVIPQTPSHRSQSSGPRTPTPGMAMKHVMRMNRQSV